VLGSSPVRRSGSIRNSALEANSPTESSGVESPNEPARPGPKPLRSRGVVGSAASAAEESSGGGFAKPTFCRLSGAFAGKIFGSAGFGGLGVWMSA